MHSQGRQNHRDALREWRPLAWLTALSRRRRLWATWLVTGALTFSFGQSGAPANPSATPTPFPGHRGPVTSVAFSPDGQWLASSSADKTVRLWEVKSGREARVLTGHTKMVVSVAFSPDGRWLASSSLDRTARIWETSTGRQVRLLQQDDYMVPLAFDPHGLLLATGCSFRNMEGGCKDSSIQLWNFGSGEIVRRLTGHQTGVRALAFSPDGQLLASGGDDNTIGLWESGSGQRIRSIPVTLGATGLKFSPDGRSLAAQQTQFLSIFAVDSGKDLHSLPEPDGAGGVAFSPDGRWLATGGSEQYLTLWDLDKWTPAHRLWEEFFGCNTVAFSPDGHLIAAGCADDTVILFEAPSLRRVRTLGQPAPYSD